MSLVKRSASLVIAACVLFSVLAPIANAEEILPAEQLSVSGGKTLSTEEVPTEGDNPDEGVSPREDEALEDVLADSVPATPEEQPVITLEEKLTEEEVLSQQGETVPSEVENEQPGEEHVEAVVLPHWNTTAESSGICGDNVRYTLHNGILRITGTGPMYDYENGDMDIWDDVPARSPWFSDELLIKEVFIDEGVTRIGNYAFQGSVQTDMWTGEKLYSSDVTSIQIPNSLISIGDGAFSGCFNLTSITIPDSVTSIGDGAFKDCSGLNNVTIPAGVTQINNDTFKNCESLTSIVIPDSVIRIGSYAFGYCSGLNSVKIPEGVEWIDYGAFYACTNLTGVTIPASVICINNVDEWYMSCEPFSECPIETVFYAGTSEQWDALGLNFPGANIYCGRKGSCDDYGHDENSNGVCEVCGASKHMVSLGSLLTPGNAASVAPLSGGGTFWTGETITVTASAKQGCTFLGWYIGDEKVCNTLSYTFEMGETAVDLTAKYMANATVQVNISADGGQFTVGESGIGQTAYSAQVEIGTQLVLTAAEPENVNAWVNGSNKIISTQGAIAVTVTADTDIALRYKATTPNQAMVEFISDYGQLMAYQAYDASETINFPAGPTKTGWTFVSWDMTEEEIHQKITDGITHITVTPLYAQKDTVYTVTVCYPDGIENETLTVTEGNTITIHAKEIDGKTFSCWRNSNSNIIGYSDFYFLRVMRNQTIRACYDETVEEVPVTVMDEPRGIVDGTNKISFTLNYNVPQGYSVVEVGVLRSTTANSEDGLVIGGENVTRRVSSMQNREGNYTYNLSVSNTDTVFYVRGYVIVTNGATGNTETIYSRIVSGSFNSALVQ